MLRLRVDVTWNLPVVSGVQCVPEAHLGLVLCGGFLAGPQAGFTLAAPCLVLGARSS